MTLAGIFAVYKKKVLNEEKRKRIAECALKLKHRGPLRTIGIESYPIEIFFHQKNHTTLFYYDKERNQLFAVDGQIYNLDTFLQIKSEGYNYELQDVDINLLIKNFKEKGSEIFTQLIGSYSGVFFDGTELFGFKDPVGAKPLYFCETEEIFAFSSEFKALAPLEGTVKPVLPGFLVSSSCKIKKLYSYPNFDVKYKLSKKYIKNLLSNINNLVKLVIKDNININQNTCALLSGGLDSNIIVHIAKQYIDDLNVFTVGTEGSKDLFYAKKYAKMYDLNHDWFEVSLEDLLDILPEVIYALETFDVALIRSSVLMYIISERIKSHDRFDVVLTGEGGDELFGGYEYLTKYQTPMSFNNELLDLLKVEHKTGLQRVDRIPYKFSIEARAPLFDIRLVELSFKIPPELKILKKDGNVAKKWILRKAFEDEIPEEFIWRKKDKFSFGVGTQFLLRDYIEKQISDEEFYAEKEISEDIILRSKEELYYWRIFQSKFNPTEETIVNLGITSVYEI